MYYFLILSNLKDKLLFYLESILKLILETLKKGFFFLFFDGKIRKKIIRTKI